MATNTPERSRRAGMLTVKVAAAQLGVSESLIYDWCDAGILAHYRFGRQGRRGKILIDEVELGAFVAACRQECRRSEELPNLRHIQQNHG
jgi:excisionase family DNA binding protein